MELNKGDVWKYGETTDPTGRYDPTYLQTLGVAKVDLFEGTQVQIKIQEKILIYGHFAVHRSLPPGNRIFR
ncbi:hypothetical protein [Mucilaginibacter flavidus]|uniref:hypothetical protein n=1 Tax=Mucilaginibacter flavidus TaxID=2949309 RepID=UPI002092326C|nr:hypothetical protein [Mucilaginibacter flavidus]